jgi:hypothetical protein
MYLQYWIADPNLNLSRLLQNACHASVTFFVPLLGPGNTRKLLTHTGWMPLAMLVTYLQHQRYLTEYWRDWEWARIHCRPVSNQLRYRSPRTPKS